MGGCAKEFKIVSLVAGRMSDFQWCQEPVVTVLAIVVAHTDMILPEIIHDFPDIGGPTALSGYRSTDRSSVSPSRRERLLPSPPLPCSLSPHHNTSG